MSRGAAPHPPYDNDGNKAVGSGLLWPAGAAFLPRNKDLPKWHTAVPHSKYPRSKPTDFKKDRRRGRFEDCDRWEPQCNLLK